MAEKKGKLAEIKTKATAASVEEFIQTVDNEQKRNDCLILLEIMKSVSGEEPKMWGGSIIGFGDKRYKSPASGREVDWFLIGFSPRKANLTLYLTVGVNTFPEELARLGKHKTGGGCLYINKLSEVDATVLEELIASSLKRNQGIL